MKYDCVILYSGGIDSSLILVDLLSKGRKPFCVLVDYKQPHKIELEKASSICKSLSVDFTTVKLPTIKKVNDVVFSSRNMLLISVGCMFANSMKVKDLYIGCNKSDYERFEDCREDFLSLMAACCKTYSVSLKVPLLYMTKTEVFKALENKNKEILNLTWTCYSPKMTDHGIVQCGECYSCKGVNLAKDV